MYLSIPVFMLIHAITIQIMLRWIVYPLLRLDRLSTKKFIVMDRYKVNGLSFIDKFHCLFCGWANGMYTFLNNRVDFISQNPQSLGPIKTAIMGFFCVIYTPPALFIQFLQFFIYNHLIAAPLELEKVYYTPLINQYHTDSTYAIKHKTWPRRFLIYQKITWAALGLALRQIESAWCPIKHFEEMEDFVFPDHHKLFFEPHQIDELRDFLSTNGTVLDKK